MCAPSSVLLFSVCNMPTSLIPLTTLEYSSPHSHDSLHPQRRSSRPFSNTPTPLYSPKPLECSAWPQRWTPRPAYDAVRGRTCPGNSVCCSNALLSLIWLLDVSIAHSVSIPSGRRLPPASSQSSSQTDSPSRNPPPALPKLRAPLTKHDCSHQRLGAPRVWGTVHC